MFITIAGKTHYLWRAVGQNGNVLGILVTSWRDTTAATRFFRKLFKGLWYVPRVLVTGKLGSTAQRDAGSAVGRAPPVEVPEQPGGELPLAHPATGAGYEEVHLIRHAQRFLSAFSGISPHFRPGRHRLGIKEYRREMTDRFTTRNEVAGTATAA